jgi:tellurite resistance protein TerC
MAAVRYLWQRVRTALRWGEVPAFVRRGIVGVIGTTILLIGIALLVLPGPAFVVIPMGLAILATEFLWARRWLKQASHLVQRIRNRKNSVPAGLADRNRKTRPCD